MASTARRTLWPVKPPLPPSNPRISFGQRPLTPAVAPRAGTSSWTTPSVELGMSSMETPTDSPTRTVRCCWGNSPQTGCSAATCRCRSSRKETTATSCCSTCPWASAWGVPPRIPPCATMKPALAAPTRWPATTMPGPISMTAVAPSPGPVTSVRTGSRSPSSTTMGMASATGRNPRVHR